MALLTPVSDNDTRAVDHLSRVALTVEHAEAGPFAQHLAIGHLDQRDLVFRAQRNDELLVGFFLAGLVENAHMCLATIESFGGFAQTAGKTVVDEGNAEDTYSSECQYMSSPKARLFLRFLDAPFKASRTDMEPEEAAASPETSTSSAAATGEVGSSPSD